MVRSADAAGNIRGMATAVLIERRRGRDRRVTHTDLGRVRSQVRALAAVDRERGEQLEQRLELVERDLQRVISELGLSTLPVD